MENRSRGAVETEEWKRTDVGFIKDATPNTVLLDKSDLDVGSRGLV